MKILKMHKNQAFHSELQNLETNPLENQKILFYKDYLKILKKLKILEKNQFQLHNLALSKF